MVSKATTPEVMGKRHYLGVPGHINGTSCGKEEVPTSLPLPHLEHMLLPGVTRPRESRLNLRAEINYYPPNHQF